MLSFGMFSFFAAAIAVRKRGFEFASPPPMRAAIEISRMILVNTRPRFASVAAFLCLIVAHFECPDMTIPRFSFGPALGKAIDFHVISRPQWRRTKPPIHGRAKGTTPVRNLSVNRKPLRNCLSLAHPPALRYGLYHGIGTAALGTNTWRSIFIRPLYLVSLESASTVSFTSSPH